MEAAICILCAILFKLENMQQEKKNLDEKPQKKTSFASSANQIDQKKPAKKQLRFKSRSQGHKIFRYCLWNGF